MVKNKEILKKKIIKLISDGKCTDSFEISIVLREPINTINDMMTEILELT